MKPAATQAGSIKFDLPISPYAHRYLNISFTFLH